MAVQIGAVAAAAAAAMQFMSSMMNRTGDVQRTDPSRKKQYFQQLLAGQNPQMNNNDDMYNISQMLYGNQSLMQPDYSRLLQPDMSQYFNNDTYDLSRGG